MSSQLWHLRPREAQYNVVLADAMPLSHTRALRICDTLGTAVFALILAAASIALH